MQAGSGCPLMFFCFVFTDCLLFSQRDPIPKFREFMLKQGLATEKEITEWEKQVEEEVEEAVEFADASERPGKEQLLENVFADPSGFGISADGGSQSPNFP